MADWRLDTLRALGAPATPQNLGFLQTWQKYEGGHTNNSAKWNWLNTTSGKQYPSMNSVGVRVFPNYKTGIQQTVATLRNGRYADIIAGLKSGDPYKANVAAGLATWLSGSADSPAGLAYAQKVLGQKATASLPVGTTAPGPGAKALLAAGKPRVVQSAITAKDLNQLARQFGFKSIGQAFGIKPAQVKQLTRAAVLVPTTRALNPTGMAFQAKPPPKSQSAGKGVAELFYDPAGKGQQWSPGWSDPIGGHSDHVHVSFSTPQTALRLIEIAQDMGLSVRENPYVDPVDGNHVSGSYHDKLFPGTYNGKQLGEAIDVSGSPAQMMTFFKTARRYIAA